MVYCEGNTAREDVVLHENTTVEAIIDKLADNAPGRHEFECVPVPGKTKFMELNRNNLWFLLVTKCKENLLPEYLLSKVKCEEDSDLSTDASVKTPAYYGHILYKNYHCIYVMKEMLIGRRSSLLHQTMNV